MSDYAMYNSKRSEVKLPGKEASRVDARRDADNG